MWITAAGRVRLTLEDTLSVLLPTAGETALLAACLHRGARAREGWSAWCAIHGPSEDARRNALAATRTLMPLLSHSAARNDLDLGRGVFSYVRAAALREELRAVRYRQIVAEGLAALGRDGTRVFVARGAALAATTYDDWRLRHCHDLDLLVRPQELPAAVNALGSVGCIAMQPRTAHGGAVLRHPSGLELSLHTRPFAIAYYDVSVDRFVGTVRSVSIDGVEALTPSAEATLAHVLGHASYSSSRRNLRWVADAWNLVAHRPDLDWDEVVARIDSYRLTLPVCILLRYLDDFGVEVPRAALAHVMERATCAGGVAEDIAVGAVHGGPRGDLRSLWRSTSSWRGRLRLVRWMIAPSPAYMRSIFPLADAWLLPVCYAYRPARFVAARLMGRTTARRVERSSLPRIAS